MKRQDLSCRQPGARSAASARSLGLGLFALCALTSLSLSQPASALPPVAADWKKIPTPPLRKFAPPKPQRLQLDNGLTVLLLPDNELPLIDVSIYVQGGSRDEAADKAGLISVFGQALRTGGTKQKTGDQIDDFLGARAAVVEASGGIDRVELNANFLKTDFDEVFPLLIEILRQPEFREPKIDLAKRQLFTAISRRNDNPMGISMREANKLAYGKSHPYARSPEYATVAAVTREDLLRWHQLYFQPGNVSIGISGDFDVATMTAALKKYLGSWPRGQQLAKPKIEFPITKPGLFFVEKEDVNQSNIQLVQLGLTKRSPDYYAIEVMNEILGGGFAARLFSNVRSKQGLAYSVRGGIGMGMEVPSVYRLSMGTASGKTVAAVKALQAEIDGMLKNPPTAAELARAKESLLNSFVFQFDSTERILADQQDLLFYGYPPDFTERYPTEIAKVTIEDVRRVAQKYLNPSGFAILVVGHAADFGAPLSELGTASPLDITIPAPPPAPAPPAVKQ